MSSPILFPLNWIPTSFHPGPKFLPQVQIPHITWPSFKGPSSVKPFLNSSAGSNLSLINSILLLSTDGLSPFCMVLDLFMLICDLFGPLNTDVLQRSLLDLLSPHSTLHPHKQMHTCPSATTTIPCFTVSSLRAHDSKISAPIFSPMVLSGLSPSFLTACYISVQSCLFTPQSH